MYKLRYTYAVNATVSPTSSTPQAAALKSPSSEHVDESPTKSRPHFVVEPRVVSPHFISEEPTKTAAQRGQRGYTTRQHRNEGETIKSGRPRIRDELRRRGQQPSVQRSRSARQKNGGIPSSNISRAAGAAFSRLPRCTTRKQRLWERRSGSEQHSACQSAASTHAADRNDIARPRGDSAGGNAVSARAFRVCCRERRCKTLPRGPRTLSNKQRSRDIKKKMKVGANKTPLALTFHRAGYTYSVRE